MMQKIMNCQYTMRPEKWKGVSREAQHLVKSLITLDMQRRLSAIEALDHPWIKNRQTADTGGLDLSIALGLRDFLAQSQLKRAVICMMAHSLSSSEIEEFEAPTCSEWIV